MVMEDLNESLGINDCKKLARRLELEAYGSVVTALRVQGELTKQRKDLLYFLATVLDISKDRHKAEIRRAVNNDKLSFIAKKLYGYNTESTWAIEGRRLIKTFHRSQIEDSYTRLANKYAKYAEESIRNQCNDDTLEPLIKRKYERHTSYEHNFSNKKFEEGINDTPESTSNNGYPTSGSETTRGSTCESTELSDDSSVLSVRLGQLFDKSDQYSHVSGESHSPAQSVCDEIEAKLAKPDDPEEIINPDASGSPGDLVENTPSSSTSSVVSTTGTKNIMKIVVQKPSGPKVIKGSPMLTTPVARLGGSLPGTSGSNVLIVDLSQEGMTKNSVLTDILQASGILDTSQRRVQIKEGPVVSSSEGSPNNPIAIPSSPTSEECRNPASEEDGSNSRINLQLEKSQG